MKISEFLKEANGQFSMTRLFVAGVSIVFVADWVYTLISQGRFSPSWELVAMMLGIHGFKVAQKVVEEKPKENEYESQ